MELTTTFFADAVKIGMSLNEADAQKYREAFECSSLDAMLNLYKANYPLPPYKDEQTYPLVKCPVLMFHGLDDPFLLSGALNNTWQWIESDLTLVTLPNAGHWVHIDAAEQVTNRMVRWLAQK